MGQDESPTARKHPDNQNPRLIRDQAAGYREIAGEWSRLAPDDITAIGFAVISKKICELLRNSAGFMDEYASLIEAQEAASNVRCNPQRDHQARD